MVSGVPSAVASAVAGYLDWCDCFSSLGRAVGLLVFYIWRVCAVPVTIVSPEPYRSRNMYGSGLRPFLSLWGARKGVMVSGVRTGTGSHRLRRVGVARVWRG